MGRPFPSLTTDPVGMEAFLERCQTAPAADFDAGIVKADMFLVHKYLQPVPVSVVVKLGGG